MIKARHKTSDLGEGGGRDIQEGADICTTMADSLMFGRNQHNTVKQLSFN